MSEKKQTTLFCQSGGCSAKLGAGVLRHVLQKIPQAEDPNLLVGFGGSDDAAVYKLSEQLAIVQTLDFFPPMVEDPYTFGQIAAANALSDIYAMGAEVRTALNIVCFPEELDLNILGDILRGGSESARTVAALAKCMQDALHKTGLPQAAIQILPGQDRALVTAMLQLDEYIDVIVPRGGKGLVAAVRQQSRVPVFSHLDGICHTYLDKDANPDMAMEVTLNAKMRRTGICGATECLLLHKDIAQFLGVYVCKALADAGCEVRAPAEIAGNDPRFKTATEADYGHEFLAPIIAVAVVDDVAAAVAHINRYGSGHTDAIITDNADTAHSFQQQVRSAIAVHNASTQFADGGEFGMGAEIGIATGKLHARGPVGLRELTTYQYRIGGSGQTRPG